MGRSSGVLGVLSLAQFAEFVGLVLFLVDGYDFDIALSNVHAVFTEYHLVKLRWYFNNRLPRKLPMLKNQTQSIRFDIESIGLDKLLHYLVLGDLKRQPYTAEVDKLASQLLFHLVLFSECYVGVL